MGISEKLPIYLILNLINIRGGDSMTNELYHHGIKGMRWGVRRYQNKDGTLTSAGNKRYARDAREQGYDKYDSESRTYYKTSKKNGRSDLNVDANRYAREDTERAKRLVDSTKQMNESIRLANQNSLNRAAKRNKENRMDLSSMTDQELRQQINRELLERQYNDVFNQKKVSRGREFAANILETTGSVLAVTSSALGIALAIKDLRG